MFRGLTGFTALEGYFDVIGSILEVGNDVLLLGNGWVMIWGCFGKMGCLYSVFDAKKQGKPIWVVRARNWKLRGGENRLSGLLEGVSKKEVEKKNVGIALKASHDESDSSDEEDEGMTIVAKEFTRFMKKKVLGKKKKLWAHMATWSDEDSFDEEEQEVANLCLMALEEDPKVTSNSSTLEFIFDKLQEVYDELQETDRATEAGGDHMVGSTEGPGPVFHYRTLSC
ncbi:hypothetical protein GQ457_15G011180 [Hibiscus cannabinus]